MFVRCEWAAVTAELRGKAPVMFGEAGPSKNVDAYVLLASRAAPLTISATRNLVG